MIVIWKKLHIMSILTKSAIHFISQSHQYADLSPCPLFVLHYKLLVCKYSQKYLFPFNIFLVPPTLHQRLHPLQTLFLIRDSLRHLIFWLKDSWLSMMTNYYILFFIFTILWYPAMFPKWVYRLGVVEIVWLSKSPISQCS